MLPWLIKRSHTTLIQYTINLQIKKQFHAIPAKIIVLQLALGTIFLHNPLASLFHFRNFISQSAGCRLWLDPWTDSSVPLCQDVKGLAAIDQATRNLSFTDPTSITRMTGCQEALINFGTYYHQLFPLGSM